MVTAKKLAAKLKLVHDLEAEVAKRLATWRPTRKQVDEYLYSSASKELAKARRRYNRYRKRYERRNPK